MSECIPLPQDTIMSPFPPASPVVRGQRLLDARDWAQGPLTVEELLDVTRDVTTPATFTRLSSLGFMRTHRHEVTMREAVELHDTLWECAYKAYAPLEEIARRDPPDRTRCEQDMRTWITDYVHRTEPTENERLIGRQDDAGHYWEPGLMHMGLARMGLARLSSVGGGALVESSDYPGKQPGWYAVVPYYAHTQWSAHLVVSRVYPEGDPRELYHLCPVWYHPSREYALDVARQILTGEVPLYGWRNVATHGDIRSIPTDHTWQRITSVNAYVKVARVLDAHHTDMDQIMVDREYLRERGQWPEGT